MKKILILLLFVALFSCNDWLTVEPEDSVTFVNYFKNEDELKALQTAIVDNFVSLVQEGSIFIGSFVSMI